MFVTVGRGSPAVRRLRAAAARLLALALVAAGLVVLPTGAARAAVHSFFYATYNMAGSGTVGGGPGGYQSKWYYQVQPLAQRLTTSDDFHFDAIGLQEVGQMPGGAGYTHSARCLQDAGEFVIEAGRPARRGDRQQRRARGKSDTIDAHRAARSLLAEELAIAPKTRNGNVECLRILLVAKRSAIKARTQAVQGMRALLVSAPDLLRDQLRGATMERLIESCARLRLSGADGVGAATKAALRRLARRCRHLTEELAELEAEIQRLVQQTAPNLLALTGVGPGIAAVLLAAAGENPGRMRSEASFAHMTGVAPLPTGSGLTSGRHRLNKGGDRQANSALWRIVIVRMRVDPRTHEYVARRTAEGLGKKEITRCLKRYVAREVYRELIATTNHKTPDPAVSSLQ